MNVRRPERLLLLVALLALVGLHPAQALPRSSTAAGSLLVFDEAARRITPVDPMTLEVAPQTGFAVNGGVSVWDLALSVDGSTLVTLDGPGLGPFTVRDPATGSARAAFGTGERIAAPRLNRDGTRLLVELVDRLRSWALYDLASGEQITRFESPEGWVDPIAADADLARFYYLTIPTNADPLSLVPELVSVDLATGQEYGRVRLPDIVAGAEVTGEPPVDGGETPYHFSQPALAVSPNGGTIAVVRADRGAFTLVDAETLTASRSVAITERESIARRVLTWLSIVPHTAAAKMGTGDVVFAEFSPDAATLYVWGYRDTPDPENGRVVASGIGLIAVDAANGEILSSGQNDQLIERLAVSPDGRSLYVSGPELGKRLSAWTSNTDVAAFTSRHFLRRSDAGSLELLDARHFEQAPWFAPLP